MLLGFADHAQNASPPNDLTLITDGLYTRSNFHPRFLLSYRNGTAAM